MGKIGRRKRNRGRGKGKRGKGAKGNEKVKEEKRELLKEKLKGCFEVDLIGHQNAPLY